MTASTLGVNYDSLRREIGYFLGFDTTYGNWTTEEATSVDDAIREGMDQFYHPPSLGGSRPHQWSFLKPTASVTTVASTGDYELPDEFGGFASQLTFHSDDNSHRAIEITSEVRIRELRQRPLTNNTTYYPEYAATTPDRDNQAGQGQRWTLMLWPNPDSAYTLTFRYFAIPKTLDSDHPYPLGGAAHSATVKAACMAAAEMKHNDEKGIWWQHFMERLTGSVAFDQQAQTPDSLGYCGDSGDLPDASFYRTRTITYNGGN